MQLENSEENLKQTNQGNLKCLPIHLGTFSIPRSKTYTPQLTLFSPKPPRAAASLSVNAKTASRTMGTKANTSYCCMDFVTSCHHRKFTIPTTESSRCCTCLGEV